MTPEDLAAAIKRLTTAPTRSPLEEFTLAVARLSEAMNAAVRPLARGIYGAWRRAEIAEARYSLVRPDGRPRRSGHRHRGTPAWRSFHRRP